jgi:hypothetical protein
MTRIHSIVPLLTLALLIGGGERATAQVVSGRVSDASTRAPLEGVRLELLDARDEIVAVALSDGAGHFQLRTRMSGSYSVSAARLGYATYRSDPLEVGAGDPVEVEVRLGVDAIPLSPFVVLADSRLSGGRIAAFERRRNDPVLGGHFLTADQIRARPTATPTQLLRALPAVDLLQIMTQDNPTGILDRSLIYLPGSSGSSMRPGMCLAQVYVDGVQVRQSQSGRFSIDDYLDGVPIAGVELYSRASAAPLQYRGTGDCGVVLYWTEEPATSTRGWGFKRLAVGFGMIAGMVLFGLTR